MSKLTTEERIGTLTAELQRMAEVEKDIVLKAVLEHFAEQVASEILYQETLGEEHE